MIIKILKQAQNKRLLRPLDIKFAYMIAEVTTKPALILAAALLSRDVGEGHVCLPLTQLQPHHFFSGNYLELAQELWQTAGSPANWKEVLLAETAVSTGERATPLVLYQECLYLHRMWQNEGKIAQFIQRASLTAKISDEKMISKTLDYYFGQQPDDWQKIAAAVILTRQVTVISGGPGTGKTTTIAKMLASLIELSPNVRPRIKLVAPTGKAAARLTESIGNTLQLLSLNKNIMKSFPQEAITLHCLLGAVPSSQRMQYHRDNPLHLDVLVVDEASMVDLQMLASLISALPKQARVIFLGDRDQLASVEAGAVLGDICRYAEVGYSVERAAELTRLTGCNIQGNKDIPAASVSDALCLLRKSYRFNQSSGIGQLAIAVKSGMISKVNKIFNNGFSDICRYTLSNSEEYQHMLKNIAAGYFNYINALSAGASPKEVLDIFSSFRVLCALREGPFGVSGLNKNIEHLLRTLSLIRHNNLLYGKWYIGCPVMILRNDRVLGLFNGDIGIVMLDTKKHLKIFFPLANGTIKSFQLSRIPAHDIAYAMTVHKSQGSEFEHTMLVLPNQIMPVLTRELVYTAITRAKKHLTIYTNTLVFNHAITICTRRYSGLVNRLLL